LFAALEATSSESCFAFAKHKRAQIMRVCRDKNGFLIKCKKRLIYAFENAQYEDVLKIIAHMLLQYEYMSRNRKRLQNSGLHLNEHIWTGPSSLLKIICLFE
jgi:NAD kinase